MCPQAQALDPVHPEVSLDGDVAFVVGPITTTLRQIEGDEERRIEGVALQVWRRVQRDGGRSPSS